MNKADRMIVSHKKKKPDNCEAISAYVSKRKPHTCIYQLNVMYYFKRFYYQSIMKPILRTKS